MGTAPVGLYNATLSAASGRGAIEHSVPGVRESAIFGGFKPLVFKRFHGADSVRVAGCGRDLCGFHDLLLGVNCPRSPRFPMGWPGNCHTVASMKCRRPVPCTGIWIERWPVLAPAQARHSEHGVPERSLAHSVSTV